MNRITALFLVLTATFPFWGVKLKAIISKKVLLILYIFFTVFVTLLHRLILILLGKRMLPYQHPTAILKPFWSYSFLAQASMRWQILMNIILFVPVGVMISWDYKNRCQVWKAMLIGLLLSSSIEIAQYYFCLGLCELDDVIHNTLGVILGFEYYKIVENLTFE